MATTNWEKAELMRARYPKAFVALQHLVITMSDCNKNKGKKSFFGRDKEQEAYVKFEKQMKEVILAMIYDKVITFPYIAKECRSRLIDMIAEFESVFPNWQDAYVFAAQYLIESKDITEIRLQALMPASDLSITRFTIDKP